MTSDTRDRAVDLAIAASLALFPLLPAGPTYLGLDWPWALEVFFLLIAALVLIVILSARASEGASAVYGPGTPVQLVARGYLIWIIPIAAATLIGVLARNPFDDVLLRVEASGLLGRLIWPMDQAAEPFYPVRVGLTCLEGGVMFWLLSAVLLRTRRPMRRVRTALRGCLLGLALVSVIAIVQYFTRVNLDEYWVRFNPGLTRSHATLDDPNALASYLVLGIGLAIGTAWSRPSRWAGDRLRFGEILVVALAGAALLTTVSRAGLAALLIACLALTAALPDRLIAGPRGRLIRRIARGTALVLVGSFVVWAAAAAVLPKRGSPPPDNPWAAVLQTVDPREPLQTVLKRRHLLWQAGLQLARMHPTLGAGLGQFPRFVSTYPGSDGPENVHNYFLQILAEAGIVGLAALGVLLTTITLALRLPARRLGRRQARFMVGLSIGVLAFVLTWLTGHPLLNVSNQLWLACVLAVGLTAIQPLRRVTAVNADVQVGGVRVLLHPGVVAVVAAVTIGVAVPRAMAAARDDDPARSRAAGVYGWELAPAGEDAPPDPRFRWTRGHAALREPVRGTVLTVPIYLARPDVPAQSVTLQVTVSGVSADPVTLAKNGWHTLSYDLVTLLGADRLRSFRTITLEFTVVPSIVPARAGPSEDARELGVGLGNVLWSGPLDRK